MITAEKGVAVPDLITTAPYVEDVELKYLAVEETARPGDWACWPLLRGVLNNRKSLAEDCQITKFFLQNLMLFNLEPHRGLDLYRV